jgi:hypothetical protein
MKASIKKAILFTILFRHGFFKKGMCFCKNSTFYQRTICMNTKDEITYYTGVGSYGPGTISDRASIRSFNKFVKRLKADGQTEVWHIWND